MDQTTILALIITAGFAAIVAVVSLTAVFWKQVRSAFSGRETPENARKAMGDDIARRVTGLPKLSVAVSPRTLPRPRLIVSPSEEITVPPRKKKIPAQGPQRLKVDKQVLEHFDETDPDDVETVKTRL